MLYNNLPEFHGDCCGWPLVKWLATIWLLSHVGFDVFYIISISDDISLDLFCNEYVTLKPLVHCLSSFFVL
jgi:hypothetical protein